MQDDKEILRQRAARAGLQMSWSTTKHTAVWFAQVKLGTKTFQWQDYQMDHALAGAIRKALATLPE